MCMIDIDGVVVMFLGLFCLYATCVCDDRFVVLFCCFKYWCFIMMLSLCLYMFFSDSNSQNCVCVGFYYLFFCSSECQVGFLGWFVLILSFCGNHVKQFPVRLLGLVDSC